MYSCDSYVKLGLFVYSDTKLTKFVITKYYEFWFIKIHTNHNYTISSVIYLFIFGFSDVSIQYIGTSNCLNKVVVK